MFDVIIAYFNGTWWLAHGVAHLGDLLSGEESDSLKIEIVTCEGWDNVLRLWDEPEEGKMPWAINPRVITRLKERDNTTCS